MHRSADRWQIIAKLQPEGIGLPVDMVVEQRRGVRDRPIDVKTGWTGAGTGPCILLELTDNRVDPARPVRQAGQEPFGGGRYFIERNTAQGEIRLLSGMGGQHRQCITPDFRQKIRVEGDVVIGIIDLVGDSGGEHADRGQLVGLDQAALSDLDLAGALFNKFFQILLVVADF